MSTLIDPEMLTRLSALARWSGLPKKEVTYLVNKIRKEKDEAKQVKMILGLIWYTEVISIGRSMMKVALVTSFKVYAINR